MQEDYKAYKERTEAYIDRVVDISCQRAEKIMKLEKDKADLQKFAGLLIAIIVTLLIMMSF